MFTFRESPHQNIHSHRLLYIHSNEKDRNMVANTQKFKSQAVEIQQQSNENQGLYFTTKANKNKTLRYSSQRKIKYFDLDLKNLVDSTTISSDLPSDRQERGSVKLPSEKHKWSENSTLQELMLNGPLPISGKNKKQGNCNPLFLETKNIDTKRNGQKPNSSIREIENLVQTEYLSEIGKVLKVNDLKKAKNIGQNNKQFKQTYSRIKLTHYKPYQKLLSSNYFKNKPVKAKETKETKEPKEELQLKKVERLLIGKNGSEYKITIQKLK